jgi:CRISPR-associated protein Cas2
VAEVLERQATGVQKSVFEMVASKRRANVLLARVERELAPGDTVRMYAVSAAGRRWSRQVGGAPIAESDAYWLV